MALDTFEKLEEKLGILLATVSSAIETKEIYNLRDNMPWRERWTAIENYVVGHLSEYGIEPRGWGIGTENISLLRDWFFYELQKKTGKDFGFCKYFIPAYRERAKYFLGGEKEDSEKNWDVCKVDGTEVKTTCVGTARDTCSFLLEELAQSN